MDERKDLAEVKRTLRDLEALLVRLGDDLHRLDDRVQGIDHDVGSILDALEKPTPVAAAPRSPDGAAVAQGPSSA